MDWASAGAALTFIHRRLTRSAPRGNAPLSRSGRLTAVHDQHRALASAPRRRRRRSREDAAEPAAAVGAEHDEARVALLGDVDDPFQVGAASTATRAGSKARGLGARGAVCRGLLGGRPHLARSRPRRTPPAGGHESDVERLPDGDDERRRASSRAARRPARSRAWPDRSRRRRTPPGAEPRFDGSSSTTRVSSASVAAAGVVAHAASSGGEYHAGPLPSRKRSRSGVCRPRSAEYVEQDGDDRAADGEAEADPERDAGARSFTLPPTVAAKCAKTGRDHERRDGAQELDDREHSLQVCGGQREAGGEQRRARPSRRARCR